MKKQIIFIRVDEDTKKEFKSMAAAAGLTMAELLRELMAAQKAKINEKA